MDIIMIMVIILTILSIIIVSVFIFFIFILYSYSPGFLNLLPIFLDHIIRPTLNTTFFQTEVHHINGKGQDGGVVYSEMKAKENKMTT